MANEYYDEAEWFEKQADKFHNKCQCEDKE